MAPRFAPSRMHPTKSPVAESPRTNPASIPDTNGREIMNWPTAVPSNATTPPRKRSAIVGANSGIEETPSVDPGGRRQILGYDLDPLPEEKLHTGAVFVRKMEVGEHLPPSRGMIYTAEIHSLIDKTSASTKASHVIQVTSHDKDSLGGTPPLRK
jgi:hypothetical protein